MSDPQTSVLYHVSTRGLARRALLEFARDLQEEIAEGHPFCCLVTSDDELRRLNKEFLKKDYATDVLSFPRWGRTPVLRPTSTSAPGTVVERSAAGRGRPAQLREPPHGHPRTQHAKLTHYRSIGEMAISWDRAKAQAAEYGHTVDDEVRILMLHGVLHLMGLDHETDRGRMSRAERHWRRVFKLPTGLIERAR